MIIDALIGRFDVTADGDDHVTLSAAKRATIVSILDGVELIGGAHGEDRRFTDEDITTSIVFKRTRHNARLTKVEFIRYLEYEVLNFLTYPSLTVMQSLRKEQHI
jgi:hypothetical protein